MIVGQRTFGKGTVQSAIALEGGKSELRLTIATYWRPSGRNIHRGRRAKPSDAWGVLPNPGFEVPLADRQLAEVLRRQRERDIAHAAPATGKAPSDDPDDPQLAKAREYLESKLKTAKPDQP